MKIKTLILSVLFLGAGFASAANQLALKGNTIYFEDPELGSLEIPAAMLASMLIEVYKDGDDVYCCKKQERRFEGKPHKNGGFEKLVFERSASDSCFANEQALYRRLKYYIDDFIAKNPALAKDDL